MQNKEIRKLTRIGKRSIGLTLPIDEVRSLGWREKQKSNRQKSQRRPLDKGLPELKYGKQQSDKCKKGQRTTNFIRSMATLKRKLGRIWNMVWLFGGSHLWTGLVGIIAGLLILYLPNKDLKEIEKL